jgi:cobalamin biosynthetic protein CobC
LLEHGGRLRQAAKHYRIPLSDWLDLSTGINPNGWPAPVAPPECWRRLPEDDDDLPRAARDYYGNASILPVAGSQAAIQVLPMLRTAATVGVLHPAYAEHAAAWRKAGHCIQVLQEDEIDARLDALDVLIIINPNNPTGVLFDPRRLLDWHARLSRKSGWLIIDEAFIDGLSAYSLSAQAVRPGLIVLRSVGKFFGLAGIRCGFVIAEPSLLADLSERLGPWTISHPSRHIAALALRDSDWRQAAALNLAEAGRRLRTILAEHGWPAVGASPLFQWIRHQNAVEFHELLAKQGILTRLFEQPVSIRLGLPGDEAAWSRLEQALRLPEISKLAVQNKQY